MNTLSGISYVLLHSDIRLGIMRSKHAVVSFLIQMSDLPDILRMSEIIVSNSAAFSELYLSLGSRRFSPKLSFRSAL